MTQLSDNEIEKLLECLDKNGFNYKLSREEIKSIIKKNIDKSLLNKDSLEHLKIDDKCDNIEDKCNTINNIELENKVENKIENKVENKVENIEEMRNSSILDKKLEMLIKESNNSLENEIKILRHKHDIVDTRAEINSVKEKLEQVRQQNKDMYKTAQDDRTERLNKLRERLSSKSKPSYIDDLYDKYVKENEAAKNKYERPRLPPRRWSHTGPPPPVGPPGPHHLGPHMHSQPPPIGGIYGAQPPLHQNEFVIHPSLYGHNPYGVPPEQAPPRTRIPVYNDKKEEEGEIIIEKHIIDPSNPYMPYGPLSDRLEDKNDMVVYQDDKPVSGKYTLRDLFDKLKKNVSFKYDKEERAYFDSLSKEKQEKVDKLETKIAKLNNIKVPIRFKVLQSNVPLHTKAMVINKLEDLTSNKLMGGSEITKYSNWVNSLLKVPFKKYKQLPIDIKNNSEDDIGNYLIDVKKTLDNAVYGHTKTKEQVIQIIAQWISNPVSVGNCIGIQGVMGNGKTTLVKNGIAKAIDRPFAFITLGGASDASFLEGHNYTYEGSTWGKIVDILISCKCMNPVFYFDELDKVSDTAKGEEIINLLIHLTDASQNSQFNDRYFNGIDLDLSKSLFIFSFNDKKKVNPILLDRLICIETDEFKLEDKVEISKNYLLKDIYKQLCIKEDTYKLTDDNIKYIIEKYTDEGGVRTLKKHLFNIFSKLNLLKLTKNDKSIKYSFSVDDELLVEKEVTTELIDKMIDKSTTEPYKLEHMYM